MRVLALTAAAGLLISTGGPLPAAESPREENEQDAEAPLATAQSPKSVLVLDTEPIGVEDAAGAVITNEIATALAEHPEVRVVTRADLDDLLSLEQSKHLLGCREDYACIAEISKGANTDLVLLSSIGNIGTQVVLTVTLIDSQRATPLSRISGTMSAVDQVADALDPLLRQLFRWEGAAATARFRLPHGKEVSFAVFDLKATGIREEDAQNLTQILSVELKRIESATVISRDDIIAMLSLEKQKDMLGCDDASCLAEIGGALGVDKLVVGQVGKLGESYVISLRLIDAFNVTVDSRVTESFKGEEEQLIRSVRHAARQLVGISPQKTGKLAVSATERGAEVFLDEKKLGQLPMPPIDTLSAKRYAVRVAKEGFFDWQSAVYIDPGDTTAVWAALKARPSKWYEKWWVWTIAGAVVLGGGAAITAYAIQGAPDGAPGAVVIE